MSKDLDSIDIGDTEYLFDDKVIGDVPQVDASAFYKEHYERLRANFVDRATFEHETELHQQAIRRAEGAEAERDATKAIYVHDREMLLDAISDLGLPILDGVTLEQVQDAIRQLKVERDKAMQQLESQYEMAIVHGALIERAEQAEVDAWALANALRECVAFAFGTKREVKIQVAIDWRETMEKHGYKYLVDSAKKEVANETR